MAYFSGVRLIPASAMEIFIGRFTATESVLCSLA
jgi:hypothetical protein